MFFSPSLYSSGNPTPEKQQPRIAQPISGHVPTECEGLHPGSQAPGRLVVTELRLLGSKQKLLAKRIHRKLMCLQQVEAMGRTELGTGLKPQL